MLRFRKLPLRFRSLFLMGTGYLFALFWIPQGTAFGQGETDRFEVYSHYASGNLIAERLRRQPARLFEFDRASLRDVLRLLADEAGIPFVALPETDRAQNTLVTFTMRTSPFRALETIAQANGVSIFYEDGVWFMRPFNDRELLARTYHLKYNPQENVTYEGSGQSGATTSVSAGGSGSGVPDLNINLQGGTDVFKVEEPKIVEEIRGLLGIPTTSYNARVVNDETWDPLDRTQSATNVSGEQLRGDAARGNEGAQVVFNSDTNALYIVATRQQHQWVEGFLSTVDRPQSLIAIEVKFFETTRDPRTQIGIDWSETMANGYGLQLSNLGADINFEQMLNPAIFLPGAQAFVPFTAVLTADQVAVRLRAFSTDRKTSTVSYPRVLTLNNKEVVIRSVVNEPVLASTSSVTPGLGSGTQTTAVSYLPIGTIINILPKEMPGSSVVLNVAVTISNILREKTIDLNNYPVASSRIYQAALQVDSGNTLAIGGIDEAKDDRAEDGIPLLKDIPGLGWAFKARGRARLTNSLILFITPTLMPSSGNSVTGITEQPEAVIPQRNNDPVPPAFTPTGRLVGGIDSLPDTIQWLDRQILLYRQINEENRTTNDSVRSLRGVINTAKMIQSEIERFETERPDLLLVLEQREAEILEIVKELNTVLSRSRRNVF